MKKLLLAVSILSAPAFAGWIQQENIDLMNDSDKSYIMRADEAHIGGAFVRCDNGKPEVVFVFDFLGDKYKDINVRFDQGEVKRVSATTSTNGKARFVAESERAEFIKQMKAHNRLIVRAIDFRGTPETLVINLNGFSAAAAKLGCVK